MCMSLQRAGERCEPVRMAAESSLELFSKLNRQTTVTRSIERAVSHETVNQGGNAEISLRPFIQGTEAF